MKLPSPLRVRAGLLAILAWIAPPAPAQDPATLAAIPSLAALEAAGAVIGEIRINAQDIFDLDDPKEKNWLFSAANWLHIQTRPETLRHQLLFRSGERLSVRVIEESERLLRGNSFLYEAVIRPIAWRDGVVDLEVRTRDSWSLQFGASVSYAGGTTSGGASFSDDNLLGTGVRFSIASISYSAVSTAGGTRRGVNTDISYPFAFDGHTSIGYSQSHFNEGSSRSVAVNRPFYALDSRWAAGGSTTKDSRLVDSYAGGAIAAQYRRRQDRADGAFGWSQGLVGGWVHRISTGLRYEHSAYHAEPGLAAPAQLPADRTLVAPYLRYEALQDEFREVSNLNQIGRPEYLLLGWHSFLEFGRATTGLGSTQTVSLYSGSLSKGLRIAAEGTLLASASLSGEYSDGRSDRQGLSAAARYFQRRANRTLYFLSLTGDATNFSDATQYLSLGGDTGLRGYPANYQLGARRVLFTAERRFYTDWYPFRLIRVGGAVFYDVGRAWAGPYQKTSGNHWSSDVGFGLRLLSSRSSSGTTLHVDFAFPLEREPGVKSFQFSFQSKSGF